MTKIVAFTNIKGGVSKTTSTLLTAYELEKQGAKILIIDADLQSNCTQMLYAPFHEEKTLLNAIVDNTPLDELIIESPNAKYPNIDLVPADIEALYTASEHLSVKTARERVIAKYLHGNLDTIEKYDYVFVDLAPSIDILTRNFLYVTDSMVIPIAHGDISALRGANIFLKLLSRDLADLGIEDNINKVVFISKHQNTKKDILDLFERFLQSEGFTQVRNLLLDNNIDNSTSVEKAIITKTALTDMKLKRVREDRKTLAEQIIDFIEELKIKEVL